MRLLTKKFDHCLWVLEELFTILALDSSVTNTTLLVTSCLPSNSASLPSFSPSLSSISMALGVHCYRRGQATPNKFLKQQIQVQTFPMLHPWTVSITREETGKLAAFLRTFAIFAVQSGLHNAITRTVLETACSLGSIRAKHMQDGHCPISSCLSQQISPLQQPHQTCSGGYLRSNCGQRSPNLMHKCPLACKV